MWKIRLRCLPFRKHCTATMSISALLQQTLYVTNLCLTYLLSNIEFDFSNLVILSVVLCSWAHCSSGIVVLWFRFLLLYKAARLVLGFPMGRTDLKPAWSYIGAKNAQALVRHVTHTCVCMRICQGAGAWHIMHIYTRVPTIILVFNFSWWLWTYLMCYTDQSSP